MIHSCQNVEKIGEREAKLYPEMGKVTSLYLTFPRHFQGISVAWKEQRDPSLAKSIK
jgi:hypothetical protein